MSRTNIDVYYDPGLAGWITNTARKEHWRVARRYEICDLIQDGYVCYLKCRNRYTLGPPKPGHQDLNTDTPGTDQRRHFMALVQRTFYNRIMTLSRLCAGCPEDTLTDLASSSDTIFDLENLLPPQPEEMSALVAVLNAPVEISEAIGKLINDSMDGGKYLRSKLRQKDGRLIRGRRALRETTLERQGRILGDPELPKAIRTYLLS